MEKDVIEKNVCVNLAGLINNADNQGIDIFLPKPILNEIQGKTLKAKFSSYPVIMNGDYGQIEFTYNVKPNTYFLSQLLMPMVNKMKDLIDFANKSSDEHTYAMHQLDSLWVEECIIDTTDLSIKWVLGS